jgi:apolipoprotein N-acyltransferase
MPAAEMRLATGLAASALSAALYGLAFPPLEWQPLAFGALAPFLVALRRLGRGNALLCAFLWTELGSLFVAHALPFTVEQYFEQPRWFAWPFTIGLWAILSFPYILGFAWTWRALHALPAALQPLLGAAAWVSFELARGRLLNEAGIFVSNPWALAGYSQVGFDAFLQIASLTGIYGVSFALAAPSAALAELWLRRPGGLAARAALGVLALGIAPALAALGFGVLVLRGADDRTRPGVTVAVVQADVDIGTRFRPEHYGRNLDVYLRLTLQALDEVRPAVVFWPENSLTFHLEQEPLYRRTIARVLAEGGAELVAGGPWGVPGDAPIYTNSVFVLDGEGQVRGRYDKQVLVPFAEYTPARAFDFVRRYFGSVRYFSRGDRSRPLPTAAGRAGIAICNELLLPELHRRRVLDGAEILVNPSNDTWFARSSWARLNLHMATVRAIEQRRWLVRASTSGPSAIVDPWGRVEVESPLFEPALIAGKVRPRSDLTLYARVGDAFALLCVASVVLALGVARKRQRGLA